ncbi:MAG TPA: methyltransferase domain-containing protein, partial [Isosphaeraceae bacterium]|nr:methyltransferase domain-containing protein [Isosphaeraceae bacterium]
MKKERFLRINVGCGHEVIPSFVNLDLRRVRGSSLQADVLRLPFADGSVIEARAGSVLEHFADPCRVLDELHRVLTPASTLIVRVPALGTNAAHLDPTHRYLADLEHWRQLLLLYFERVNLGSQGVKYRSNRLLVALQRSAIWLLGFHDLGQCWVLTATGKHRQPRLAPRPWWADSPQRQPTAMHAPPRERSWA